MDYNSLCRLCLERTQNLINIFQRQEDDIKINEVLSHYSLIDLSPDDEISNKICSSCWSTVYKFHEFCLKVHKVQQSISFIVYVDNKNDVNEVILGNMCEETEYPKEQVPLIDVTNEEVAESIEDTLQLDTDFTMTDIKHEAICIEDNLKETSESCPTSVQNDIEKVAKKVKIKTDCYKEKKGSYVKKVQKKLTDGEKSNEKLINSFFALNCDLCQQTFQSCEKHFEHYQEKHKIRGFIVCCEKKYFKTAKLAEHVLWHTKPDLFKCTKCDLLDIFPDKKQLEAHMLTHLDSDTKVFQCNQCDKTFVKRYRYEQHKLIHLPEEEKKYLCPNCGKAYATESLLRVHVRVVHMESYAHMCEICSKVFKSREFFEKHQLEHMGQTLPRLQCQICNAWMKNEHTMRAHRRLHDDEGGEHKCELCGKTGPSRNSIVKHKRYVHFSERKFKCTLCDKAFKRAVSLKEHMSLHTGETLYKCTFCTKTFNFGANMFAHKKKMHFEQWKLEKEKNKE